jgi:hypothetical protein
MRMISAAGFAKHDLVGCEGVISSNEEQVNRLNGDSWEAWVSLNYRLGREPSLCGAADHLLIVGQKL